MSLRVYILYIVYKYIYIIVVIPNMSAENKKKKYTLLAQAYLALYNNTDMERQKKIKNSNSVKRKTALASRQKRIGIQLSSGHHAERISNGMRCVFFIYTFLFFFIFFIKPHPKIFFLFIFFFNVNFADERSIYIIYAYITLIYILYRQVYTRYSYIRVYVGQRREANGVIWRGGKKIK